MTSVVEWLNHPIAQAVWLSLKLATLSSLVLLCIALPLAWWLSGGRSVLRQMVQSLATLPLVLPPSVLGFYLLIFMGPQGPLGQLTQAMGWGVWSFTFGGLLLGSVIFSMPFALQPLVRSFEDMGRRPMEVAATLGYSPWQAFWAVAFPMARPAVWSAATLSFAHTLGEFGVVLMVGGNIPGQTQVLSTQIYTLVESMAYAQAHWLSAGLLVFSLLVLLLTGRWHRRSVQVLS